MIAFIKKVFAKRSVQQSNNGIKGLEREQLEVDVKKGSEEAVKRYKGVLQRLAEYDRI